MQLRKHFMQRVKRAEKNLQRVTLIERLRNRIIAPNNMSSDEEYMDVSDRNSASDRSPLRIWNEIEAQDINIPQAFILENNENEREEAEYNEQDEVFEAFDLSDDENDEIILQDEVDREEDALENRDYDEDINENYFETEEQKAKYVAENLREWAIYDGYISKKSLIICYLD